MFRAQHTLMGAEIEVKLCRVSDPNVHGGPGGDVPALAALLLLVGAEQSGVVTLLDNYECDARLVVSFKLKIFHGKNCFKT